MVAISRSKSPDAKNILCNEPNWNVLAACILWSVRCDSLICPRVNGWYAILAPVHSRCKLGASSVHVHRRKARLANQHLRTAALSPYFGLSPKNGWAKPAAWSLKSHWKPSPQQGSVCIAHKDCRFSGHIFFELVPIMSQFWVISWWPISAFTFCVAIRDQEG